MKTLLVNYDLGMPETSESYRKLIEAIKSHNSWAKILKSDWAISTEKSCSAVRDELLKFLDSNDKLFVVDITATDWASYGLPKEVTDWLNANNMALR